MPLAPEREQGGPGSPQLEQFTTAAYHPQASPLESPLPAPPDLALALTAVR